MVERIEGPLDYRILWEMLRREIKGMSIEMSTRTMVEKELERIPHYQGAWNFANQVLVKMDDLLREAKRGNSAAESNDPDGNLQ